MPHRSVLFAFVLLLAAVAGCAATRGEILSRSMAGVDAAEKAFVTFDRAHQEGIVSAATSLEDGQHALEAYRAQRAKVTAALVSAYGAIALASSDGSDASLRSAITTISALVAALQELGVVPGGKS